MALTEMQKNYLTCIKASMKDTEMAVGVALLTKTEKQMQAMIAYLQENLQGRNKLLVMDEEILEKAIEIHRTIR